LKPILAGLGGVGENEFYKFFIMKELELNELSLIEGGGWWDLAAGAACVGAIAGGAILSSAAGPMTIGLYIDAISTGAMAGGCISYFRLR